MKIDNLGSLGNGQTSRSLRRVATSEFNQMWDDPEVQADVVAANLEQQAERDERTAMSGASAVEADNESLRRQLADRDRTIARLMNEKAELKKQADHWKGEAIALGWKHSLRRTLTIAACANTSFQCNCEPVAFEERGILSWAADKLHLYSTHRAALVEYALPIVGDRARAEDVVQEAFMRFSPRDALDADVQRPLGYLYRIVRNLAVDFTRRRSTEARVLADDRSWWLSPATIRTPEQDFSHEQHLQEIDRMLADTSPLVQKAVNLHRIHGLTLLQIAEALGVSTSSAHRLVREGLGIIAVHLTSSDD